jgi:hypothetical protein
LLDDHGYVGEAETGEYIARVGETTSAAVSSENLLGNLGVLGKVHLKFAVKE